MISAVPPYGNSTPYVKNQYTACLYKSQVIKEIFVDDAVRVQSRKQKEENIYADTKTIIYKTYA